MNTEQKESSEQEGTNISSAAEPVPEISADTAGADGTLPEDVPSNTKNSEQNGIHTTTEEREVEEEDLLVRPSTSSVLTGMKSNHRKRRRKRLGRPKLSRKRSKELAVTIGRVDGVPVDQNLAFIIRCRVGKHIAKAVADGVDSIKLNFYDSGLISGGIFLVTPMNESARDWLLSCDFGSHSGVDIKAYRRERRKISIWIPGSNRADNPMQFLRGQNAKRSELRLQDWTLIARENSPEGETLIVGIPLEASACFTNRHIWLYYQISQVRARLIQRKALLELKERQAETDSASDSDCDQQTDNGSVDDGSSGCTVDAQVSGSIEPHTT